MRPETTLDEWLRTIELGDGRSLRLDDRNLCWVTMPDGYSLGITVDPEKRRVGFVAFLVPAPEPGAGPLMHAILSLNLGLLAARNATLAVDAESGMLVMGRTAAMDGLDAAGFRDLFAETAMLADGLRATVLEAARGKAPSAATVDELRGSEEVWLRL